MLIEKGILYLGKTESMQTFLTIDLSFLTIKNSL